MRLGIFGGTFDPVHFGHLILAEQCREQADLERVLFVPAARPPHKQADEPTAFDRRVEMLELAISGHTAFAVAELEKDRPGPSYTVDTLSALQQQYKDAELFLLVGADMLQDFPSWRDPQQICDLATLMAVQRPGWELPDGAELQRQLGLTAEKPLRIQQVTAPLIYIAGRDLRQRIQTGRSIRYMVPRAVEIYIQEKHLYVSE